MAFRIKASTINKGIIISVLLSVGVMVLIMMLTTKKDTWRQLIDFRWPFIPVIFVLSILRWYADGMAFVVMAKHGSRSSIKPGRAAVIRLEGNLVGSIVPVLIGNFTMNAYLLHKEKLRIHESMALNVLRNILPIFLFIINIPILFLMKSDPDQGRFFHAVIEAISLPIVLIIVAMVITLFYPKRIKHLAMWVIRWCSRIKIIHKKKLFAVRKKMFHEINQFSSIFWMYLRNRKRMLITAFFWIVVTFTLDYIVALAVIWGFGIFPSFWDAMAFQNLIRPILFFALTPGGVGVSELSYLGFYSRYLDIHLIGMAVLLWRLALTYIPMYVGAVFMMREFKTDNRLKTMLLQEGHVPEDGLENNVIPVPDDEEEDDDK
jgi:uncharacterized protein (TIRG00374 family)